MDRKNSGEGKVVCVTGASGFIASWLVKLLLQRGYTVNVTVRNLSFSDTLKLLELIHQAHKEGAMRVVKEYEFDHKKLANVQSLLEKLVANNYYLNQSAKEAYRSYLLSYNSHSMKEIFNVHRLDLQICSSPFE